MEYSLWKRVLLDWVNSTGFLVRNYENLSDTQIDAFFIAFKKQIKSTHIKSDSVVAFVRDYYKDFYLKLEDNKVPTSEYVYYYSLFLHFACVLHADAGIQQICNNMVRKNQEMIEKYLDYLFKIGKCERAIVQNAIEEAENCDTSTAQVSPITRNLQSILSNTSPQTPKSKMLNTWNLENRNLKAQLETERFERGYLEMQLNQCEKKLLKLDEDFKEAMIENNLLKKQVHSLDKDDHINQSAQTEVTVKQLQREVTEKENELLKLTISFNEAKDDIDVLKEKLQFAENQIKLLNDKLLDSFTEAETFKNQLDEHEKMINYVSNNNKELSDMLKELQSNSKKSDFDSSASYELLNSTANDLNTSSFFIKEENLADAVVDIRLIDQQRRNIELNETINRVQNELTAMQAEASKLYQILNESTEDTTSQSIAFAEMIRKSLEIVNENKVLSQEIQSNRLEITVLKEQINSLQISFEEMNIKFHLKEKENENLINQSKTQLVELERFKTSLRNWETEKSELNTSLLDVTSQLEQIQSEKRELIAKHFVELRQTRSELEAKLNVANIHLETQLNEKNSIHAKFEQLQVELDETMDLLAKHKLKIDDISNELTTVRNENKSIQLNFENATSEINLKRMNCEKLALEKVQLEKKVAALDATNKINEIKLSEYLTKFNEITSEKNNLEQSLKSTQCELAKISKSLESAQSDLSATKIKKSSLEDKIAQLDSTINELSQQMVRENEQFVAKMEASTEKSALVQKERDSLQEKLKIFQSAAIDQSNKLDALAQEKLMLEEKVNVLTEINNNNEEKMTEYEIKLAKMEELTSEKLSLSESLKSTQSKLDEVSMSLETSNKDLATVNTEKNSLVSKVIELNRTIDELKQRMVKEQEQFNKERSELAEKLVLIEQKRDSLQEDLEKFQSATIDQSQKLDALTQEKLILEEKVNALTETNNNNEEKMTEYEIKLAKMEELTSEKLSLSESLKSTQSKLDEISMSLETSNKDLATVNTEKNSLVSKVIELNRTIDELNQQMVKEQEQFNKERSELAEKLVLIEQNRDSLQEDLEKFQSAAIDQSHKLDALTQEKLTLEDSLKSTQCELAKISKSLEAVQSELSAATSEKSSLEDKIAQLDCTINELSQQMVRDNEQFVAKMEASTEKSALVQKERDSLQEKLKIFQSAAIDQSNKLDALAQEMLMLEEKVNVLTDINNNNEEKMIEYETKLAKMEELTSEKLSLSESLKSTQSKLDEISISLETSNKDLATVNTEKNSLVSKVIELNRTIDELNQQMVKEQEQFNKERSELAEKLVLIQQERDLAQGTLKQVECTALEQSKQLVSLLQDKEVLTSKAEQYIKDIEGFQNSLAKLQNENKVLLESATNKEQLITLNEQLVRMEKNYNEQFELWKKERENLIQDVRIFKAKLMKEREAHEQKDREYKDMRNGFEEKLEKMKERMKSLYKEEMAKVQDKHEKQLAELVNENRRYTDKLIFYDDKTKEFSQQIHSLNEEKLMLLKEHEIMKSKLRTYEIGSTLNNGTTNASKFFDKIRGGNFRMEDEEGELFDNTYLDELKGGSVTGRESLTFEEIQRRNSMVPPHLRSSYMPQFGENEPKTNENTFKSLDDSMFSTQSDMRRSTVYKKPGPPTPSKNSGRLSLGGADVSRGDVLRENGINIGRPSIGSNTSKASKKITPGKLSRIFSTSKLKDEDKENYHPTTSGRNTLHQLQKLFFSTSTPRRHNVRRSSMPKFETTSSFLNTSVSTIESKFTADSKCLSTLSRNLFAQTRRVSHKILYSVDKRPATVDSTPEYEKVHCDSTKLASSRKSFIKKRSSILKKRAQQTKTQKEKRLAAYNKIRRMSKVERAVDETYSIGSALNNTGATYDLEMGETTYESDILKFQEEVNERQGPVEIIVQNVEDEVDFEKLCNVKESACPFEDKKKSDSLFAPGSSSLVLSTDGKSSPKSAGEGEIDGLSPQSVNSNYSANSTTRMSSHCGRIGFSQQKIPKITTYKAEKKSFDNDSQSSMRSYHNSQALITTVKSIHSIVTVAWNDSHEYARYYIISITFLVIALIIALIRF